MSEKNSRKTVVDNFRLLGAHCQRIEDSITPGVPDLNLYWHGEGWIEFKHVEEHKLPKRATTDVRIGLKPEQCDWLKVRAEAGGRVAVLTKIEPRLWLVHRHPTFVALRDGVPLATLLQLATLRWEGDFKHMAQTVLEHLIGV